VSVNSFCNYSTVFEEFLGYLVAKPICFLMCKIFNPFTKNDKIIEPNQNFIPVTALGLKSPDKNFTFVKIEKLSKNQ
jgi:hypothetical protein